MIEVDRVDQSAVVLLSHVEVAEFGSAYASSSLYLVCHLDLDVFAALADLDLVHDVRDRFHGVAHVTVSELLLRGDKCHASFSEPDLGDGCVQVIAKHPRAHVDHYVLHLGVIIDVAHHPLELGPLLYGLCGVTWVDELVNDRRTELARCAVRPLFLGGDAVAVVIDVRPSVQLANGRNSEIEDRRSLTRGFDCV